VFQQIFSNGADLDRAVESMPHIIKVSPTVNADMLNDWLKTTKGYRYSRFCQITPVIKTKTLGSLSLPYAWFKNEQQAVIFKLRWG
jgi:hypothetical protein